MLLAVLLALGLRPTSTLGAAPTPASPLTFRVTPSPWRIEVLGPDGGSLFSATPRFQLAGSPDRWLSLAGAVSTNPGGGGTTYVVATEDPGTQAKVTVDMPNGNLRVAMTLDTKGTVAKVGDLASLAPDEHFYGLGMRYLSTDQRGKRLDNWLADRRLAGYGDTTYLAMPYFLSTRGYGLVVDTAARDVFDFGATRADQRLIEVQASSLTYTVLYGPQPLQVLDRFTQYTGRPPLPPAWAFGVWTTEVGGQDNVLARAQRYRDLRIPVTSIMTYDYNDDQSNIGWPWPTYLPLPPGPYPNLRVMNDKLHALGFKSQTYLGPDFHADRPSFQFPLTNGMLIRSADGSPYIVKQFNLSHVDLTKPMAIMWWQQILRHILTDLDFDGWMEDLGDIEPVDAVFANGQTGATMHNAFPLYYHRASWEEIQRSKPDAVALLRSGWTGIQPYVRASWTGDEVMDWSADAGLPSVVPAMLNEGASGIAMVSTNIGGYVGAAPIRGADLPANEERELWIRWLEVGAATPTMRHYLGDKQGHPTEIFSDDQTIGLFSTYARWHTSLFPYLYAYAAVANQTGAPILRHLALQFPGDPQAYGQDSEFMLGDWLLVSPVLKMGERQHSFYLPAGQWVDYWTSQALTGPAQATVPAPLERLPVLARVGAIIPMLPDSVQTLTQPDLDATLVVQIFPGPDNSFTMADGTIITQAGNTARLMVQRAPRPRQLEWRVMRPTPPNGVNAAGRSLPPAQTLSMLRGQPSGWYFDPAARTLYIRSPQESPVEIIG